MGPRDQTIGSADVYEAVEGMPKLLQITFTGSLIRYGGSGPQPTYLACAPPPTDKPITFPIHADFPIGTFVFCLPFEPTPEGCGTFRTVKS